MKKLRKIHDESFDIPKKRGNGKLIRTVWIDEDGHVAKYTLAYINHQLCRVDNGRALGFDNDHGYHHRHFMGKVEAIKFSSYTAIETRFEQEWRKLQAKLKDAEKWDE